MGLSSAGVEMTGTDPLFDPHTFFGPAAEFHEEWHLPTAHLGWRILVFRRIDSTNTQALRLVDRPELDGVALLADEQLSGRGQHGRSWFANPKAGVLLSLLMMPPPLLTRPVLITALASVAVCQLVQARTGKVPRIKWPNDVLVDGRKICGILIEQARHGDHVAVVLGLGLNVAQSEAEFVAAGLPGATSLAACGDVSADRDEVARQLLRLLDEHYTQLLQGNLVALESAWVTHLGLVGEEVEIDCHNATYRGYLLEATFGSLTLLCPDGDHLRLPPESIRHIERR
jgi:BirA family transcriptional regulator, biotin operon repressor / biotin---[acetyl-CoA-carboxylase] ligase